MANGQWKEGDTVRFMSSAVTPMPVFSGLFFYSGFGMGHYYAPDGQVVWMSRSEATEAAQKDGVTFSFVDSFAHYHPVSLMG